MYRMGPWKILMVKIHILEHIVSTTKWIQDVSTFQVAKYPPPAADVTVEQSNARVRAGTGIL